MKLEISFSQKPKGVELLFSEELPKELAHRLKAYGFKKGFLVPLKWTAAQHHAYITYAGELKEVLLKKRDALSVLITPSFQPSEENIDHNKFSYVTISYTKDGNKQQDNYVVFDSYLKVATAIATDYGRSKYQSDFIAIDVSPRKFKRKVRKLLVEGKVITGLEEHTPPKESSLKETPTPSSTTWVVYSSKGKIDSLQISEAKAQAYIKRRPEFSQDKMKYEEMEKAKAFELLEEQKDNIGEEYETAKESSNQLTNKNGVYTKDTAGKNYETIDIPIPKSAKYTASITMVKDENGYFRMATDTHKQFGDFSGHSSPVSEISEQYKTRKEALKVAIEQIYKRIQKELKSHDSILNNDFRKDKMLQTALIAVETFTQEQGVSKLSKEEETTSHTQYKLDQGWSNLDEKTIAAFQQFINEHPNKLKTTLEPSEYLDIDGKENPTVASATISSDKDKIFFQVYKDNTMLISSLTSFSEALTYGGSTMPKDKLKKAIQHMIKHPERLGENEVTSNIIKDLEAALWQEEDETHPVNQIIIKGISYHQSRLRELLLTELNKQSLAFQQNLLKTLSKVFNERRPYSGSKKPLDTLSKSEEKKEKSIIRSYVDDIIVDHDLWQIQATGGEVKKIEDGVMAWLINQLFETAEKLVDKPSKPKQMAKKTSKINQYELNVLIEDFIVEKDSENHVYTEEDKNYLKQYTGGGGLIKQGAKGKGILYEYFTPDAIVQKMWGLAIKYGYKDGDVLEPACGIGNFIKYTPENAKVVGHEINPYSNRIAEILFPHATIYQQPFETLFFAGNVHLKDDFGDTRYDLVIGNPPYGEFSGKWAGMGEKKWTKATEYDQYFITRGLDLLRENGLLIFIVPSSFLNNGAKYNKLKENIAAKADLIDAYRLPERVFKTTDIGTDIVVFKKL